MRLLVMSPPFAGHSNVLTRTLPSDAVVVVTGWENVGVPSGIGKHIRLDAGCLTQADPALWTLPRVAKLLPQCLRLAEQEKPDRILYDFFSLEGYVVGKALGIPAWCSIPAFVGPYDSDYLAEKLRDPENIRAIKEIEAISGVCLHTTMFEMLSDGLHIPADLHIVWSWPTVTETSRWIGKRVFVGTSVEKADRYRSLTKKPTVYLSFGTVVMGNLWDQQPGFEEEFRRFLKKLSDLWGGEEFYVRFVTQGREVLPEYPSNWIVSERVNQGEVLREADVFVTHGGSNSFHEAIVRQVPMVVLPFFGDQAAVANRVEDLGIGANVGRSCMVDTKDALSVFDPDLAFRIDAGVRRILKDQVVYEEKLSGLCLRKDTGLQSLLSCRIPFEEGDLLYGTNVARRAYVEEIGDQKTFQLMQYRPYSQIAEDGTSLPRIVDIYHDVIRDDQVYQEELRCDMEPYTTWLREYHDFLGKERDITQMCLRGLDFFSSRARIHFLLDDWDPEVNWVTTQEVIYCLRNRERFESTVTFYRRLAGTWVSVGFEELVRVFGPELQGFFDSAVPFFLE